jgi:hypothetical protein
MVNRKFSFIHIGPEFVEFFTFVAAAPRGAILSPSKVQLKREMLETAPFWRTRRCATLAIAGR